MAGPFHSALGCFSGKGPTTDEWKWGVESMREVAEHAEKVGVTLGVEYLNRFECYLLNTAADGARFCRDVNHPRCKMMYDTFHSHIEEKNIPDGDPRAEGLPGPRPHFRERPQHARQGQRPLGRRTSTRSTRSATTALMVIEAFGLALEKIVPATKIWRRMYESEKQLATDALKFMKAEVAKRWK